MTMTPMPLVSCIMPTHNRRRFVPLALNYFLRQDYEPRELIVVDDGDDPVADLVPQDPRIRYVRLDRKQAVGAKRNLACRLAQGEVIVHWDDDDWMADWRLTYQVAQLMNRKVDMCGLDRLLFLHTATGQAWQYVYSQTGKPWLAGGTLCYRKTLWQRNPFPEIDVGEDNRFVWSREAKRLLALPDNTFYVAMIHDGNTSPKRTTGLRWRQHPIEPLRKMLASDWEAYLGGAVTPKTNPAPGIVRNPQPITLRRSPLAPPLSLTTGPSVTVSLPYYDCRRYLRRAVDSILSQTHTNLTLVVVNDGDPNPPWDLLASIDDPRLVLYDLGANRGRYFVDAVILAATPDPYLLIQDADDWSEPQRLAKLLSALQAGKALGAISASRLWPEGSGNRTLRSRSLTYPNLRRPLSERFEFRSDHHGLFCTEALRQIGGNYCGYRIGYDTLLINLLCMVGELAYVEQSLYHRQMRADSLTTSARTGMRSAQRHRVRNELAALYATAFQAYRKHKASGAMDSPSTGSGQAPSTGSGQALAAEIYGLCQAHVTDQERSEIEHHAARLRELILASQHARPTSLPPGHVRCANDVATSDRPVEMQLQQMVHDLRLPWGSWTVTPDLALRLAARLCDQRPARILEAGSGVSTALLARYAELTGAEVVVLEHDPRYFRQTAALLDRLSLRRTVDLRLAPLEPIRADKTVCAEGIVGAWYQPLPQGVFDFVFVDGPPKQVGREATLFALADHLSTDSELWLHNGHRDHEQACLTAWRRAFRFDSALMPAGKGAWVIRNVLPVEV